MAASTRTHALSPLLSPYPEALALPMGRVDDVERAKKPKRPPVVFTTEEVGAALGHPRDEPWLMASPLYGSGPRLMECVRLRVEGADFDRLPITARGGKGGGDRITMLPASLAEPPGRQSERARTPHAPDLRGGYGQAHLPYAPAGEIPFGRRRVVLALRLRRAPPPRRPAPGTGAAPACRGDGLAEGRQEGDQGGGGGEARELSHLPPHLRHADDRKGLRDARRAGDARPRESGDDPALHARARPGRSGREQPARR